MLAVGCDRHRDLYVYSSPTLAIEADWMPSMGTNDMSGRATVRLYGEGRSAMTDFFSAPGRLSTLLTRGKYDVLVFNGQMFAEDNTNIAGVYFRNTGAAATFEAVAREVTSTGRRLVRADGEYVATNEMEVMAAAWSEAELGGEAGYEIKYTDGVECDSLGNGTVVKMTPRPISYPTRVVVRITNPESALIGNAALKGFAGSAFAASGKPSQMRVTHQVSLNNLVVDSVAMAAGEAVGTISSADFVTFGPPIDLAGNAEWSYELEVSMVLKDGTTVLSTHDVRTQVEPVIEKLRQGEWGDRLLKPIVIEVGVVKLPVVDASIGVETWKDEEIIRVRVSEMNNV